MEQISKEIGKKNSQNKYLQIAKLNSVVIQKRISENNLIVCFFLSFWCSFPLSPQ